MQLLEADTLRDVVAYPKIKDASEPMTNCPSAVDSEQLTDLGIAVLREEEES